MAVCYTNFLLQNSSEVVVLDPAIPMYYNVPEDNLDQERSHPHSSLRVQCPDAGMFLWNQAMFIIAQLLTGGLLHINELDPIRRYLPSYNRPRKAGRYSAFQVRKHRKKLNT